MRLLQTEKLQLRWLDKARLEKEAAVACTEADILESAAEFKDEELYDRKDLLMELLSAKEDGYLPGLAYLDTVRGFRPIV